MLQGLWRRGTMRRRVLFATVVTAVLSVVLFALPLGYAISHLYRAQTLDLLGREANQLSAHVSDDALARKLPIRLPPPRAAHVVLALYDAAGRRFAGTGPHASSLATRTAAAQVGYGGDEGSALVELLPITADNGDRVVVRAAIPSRYVQERVEHSWLLMTALAAAVLAIVTIEGARRATQIARPVERLSRAAADLGEGDFTITATTSGVVEADAASRALAATARRLGTLLERERNFTADASHQLRTPLTRLRIRLEAALLDPQADLEGVIGDAVRELDALEESVRHLLAVAREIETDAGACDPVAITRHLVEHWRPLVEARGRRLALTIDRGVGPTAAPETALRHVLDVLVDNALTHGSGRVGVHVRPAGDAVAIDVSDEGPGVADPAAAFVRRSGVAAGNGIGLPLARQVIEAAGGRLLLTSSAPEPVFTILLPSVAARDDERVMTGV